MKQVKEAIRQVKMNIKEIFISNLNEVLSFLYLSLIAITLFNI